MNYPKISIVTQCYNRERFIGDTIESILSQGYPNLEYIVIDDNSTDRSWEIIQKYKDKLAVCERLEGHRDNPAYATNYGFSKATGEVMTWINSKHIVLPKTLFTVGKVFADFPEVEWVSGIGSIMNEESMIVNVIPVRKDLYEHLRGSWANISQESTFWRRSLWERTGAHLSDTSPAPDTIIWSEYFFPNATFYHLNTIISCYRKTRDSFSGNRLERFHADIARSRDKLKTLVPKRKLCYSYLFRAIYPLKPLLRNIPDNVYAKIPLLNEFCHESIRFKNTETLERYKRNPFRTIFPW
jgi:glycosyltransferase involved in cell wall biosynthesis